MAINNFKELARQQEREIGSPPEEIRNNLVGNINLFQFIGEIIELYLPKVFNLIVRMSGGSPRQNVSNTMDEGDHKSDYRRPRYPNTDS
jgi:hypothetical protein